MRGAGGRREAAGAGEGRVRGGALGPPLPRRPPAAAPREGPGQAQVSLPLRSQQAGQGKEASAPPGRDRAGAAPAAPCLGGTAPGAGRSSGPAAGAAGAGPAVGSAQPRLGVSCRGGARVGSAAGIAAPAPPPRLRQSPAAVPLPHRGNLRWLVSLSLAAAAPEGQGGRLGAGGCPCLRASGSRA